MEVTLRDVLDELRDLRSENRDAHDRINGRLHAVEVNRATDRADLDNMAEQVKTLSIVDKSVAVLSGLAATVAGVLLGK